MIGEELIWEEGLTLMKSGYDVGGGAKMKEVGLIGERRS